MVIEVRLAPKANQDLLDPVVLLEHLAQRASSVGAAIKALGVPKGTQDLQVTCGLDCGDNNPRRDADDLQVEWDEEVQWAPEASAAVQVCLCVFHALCLYDGFVTPSQARQAGMASTEPQVGEDPPASGDLVAQLLKFPAPKGTQDLQR